VQSHIEVDNELKNTALAFAELDVRPLNHEARQQVADALAAVENWLCDEYLETLATTAERHSAFFELYTRTQYHLIETVRSVAPNAQHYTRKLIALTERWLSVAEKTPANSMEINTPHRPWIVLTYTIESGRPGLRWSPGPRELELFE